MRKKIVSGMIAAVFLLTSGLILPAWGQTRGASGETTGPLFTETPQMPEAQGEMLEKMGLNAEKRLQNIFSATTLADKSSNSIGENIVKNSADDRNRNRRRRSQRSYRAYKLGTTLALIGGTLTILTLLLSKNNRANCNSFSTNCF